MNLKEYIKSLVRKQLEEQSTTAGVPGYLSKNFVSPKGQGKNAATKQAEEEGWKQTKGETTMPSDSKLFTYKSLTGKKKKGVKIYNEGNTPKDKIIAQIMGPDHPLAKKSEDKWSEGEHELFNNLMKQAETGKTPKMNESLNDIIEQELLNEVTYNKFKNEVKYRTKAEQLHKAIREVKRKLQEIDRIVEYTQRMKIELSEGDGIQYWNRTNKAVAAISEMVNHLNNKIKNLNQ